MFYFYKLHRSYPQCERARDGLPCPSDCDDCYDPEYCGFVAYDRAGKLIAAQDTDQIVLSMSEQQVCCRYQAHRMRAASPREAAIEHGFFAAGRDNWLGGGTNPVSVEGRR